MVLSSIIDAAIDGKLEDLASFVKEWRKELRIGVKLLLSLAAEKNAKQVETAVKQSVRAGRAPGAWPSKEWDQAIVRRFAPVWRSHEEARQWSKEVLQDRVTFAADGSQAVIEDLWPCVAFVQVATFENPHRENGGYRKSVVNDLITLFGPDDYDPQAENDVKFRRFQLEVESLARFVEERRGWRERKERMPLGFFDGSLLVSLSPPHTLPQANRWQQRYAEEIQKLVRVSHEAHVPVIGYIDQSLARDVVRLLNTLEGGERFSKLLDVHLFNPEFLKEALVPSEGGRRLSDESVDRLALNGWGDRTIFFYCLREGPDTPRAERRDDWNPPIGFAYIRTNGVGGPARLDIPSWVYEEGLLDEVVDVVRAECVVGNGYPYPIEAADAASVIRSADRHLLAERVLQQAQKRSIPLGLSRKMLSKERRR